MSWYIIINTDEAFGLKNFFFRLLLINVCSSLLGCYEDTKAMIAADKDEEDEAMIVMRRDKVSPTTLYIIFFKSIE